MIRIPKNLSSIINMDSKSYRVIMIRKKSLKSVLITEIPEIEYGSTEEAVPVDYKILEKSKEDSLSLDDLDLGDLGDFTLDLEDVVDDVEAYKEGQELEEWMKDEDKGKDELENILLNWDTYEEETLSEQDIEDDLLSFFDEDDDEDDIEIDELDLTNPYGDYEDLDNLFADEDDYEYEDDHEDDIKNSILDSEHGFHNAIIDLRGLKQQEDSLRIVTGSYSEADTFSSTSVLEYEQDNINQALESSLEDTEDLEETIGEGGLASTIVNDTSTKTLQFIDDTKKKEYKFNGEKIVYHWLYVETQVEDFEEDSTKFYDLITTEYYYGNYTLALTLTSAINKILQTNYEFDEEYGEPAQLTNIEIDGRDVLVTKHTYTDQDLEYASYREIRGREVYREYYTDDVSANVTLSSLPSEIYAVLVKDVPYSKKQDYGFSRKFKQKLKSGRKEDIRFPEMEYFKSFLNLEHVEKSDYRIIDDEEGLIWVKEQIDKLHPDHVIAYDAETTGLKFHRWLKPEDRDELVTHSLSWKDNQAVIFPIRMKNRKNISIELMNKYIKPILEERVILAHNGKADVLFNMYDNIEVNLVEDTYILIKHLLPYIRSRGGAKKTRTNVRRSLNWLLNRTFGRDMIDLNKYVFKPQGIEFDFSILPDDYLIYYGCPDTDQLRQLWKVLRVKLRPEQEVAYKTMVRFSKLMAEKSTFEGIRLSEEKIMNNRTKTMELLDLLKAMALETAGETEETLNIGSSKQIVNFIYGKLGVPVTDKTKRTKEGFLSADKYVIEGLSREKRTVPLNVYTEDIMDIDGDVLISADDLNKAKYPFLLILRAFNDNRKNLTAYYDGLLKNSYDGIYYPEPEVGSTATWRTTERTQITKDTIKEGLGVYDENYYVVSMDFSAEELRLAVNQSDDEGYKDILEHPERDPHRAAASQIFNVKEYEVTHALRSKAKTANFGIIYGMSATRLAKQMAGTEYINSEQLAEGRKVYAGYKYRYGRMIQPLAEASEFVMKNGWLINKLGYMMIYEDVLDLEHFENQIFDVNRKKPADIVLDPVRHAEYAGSLRNKAGNYPIQSWAAGLLQILCLKFEQKLKEHGIYDKVSIPLTVHDEIDLIVHKDVHPLLMMKILKEVFETKLEGLGKRTVPLFVGIGYGMSWGEAKSDDAEIPVGLQNLLVQEYEEGRADDIPVQEIPEYFSNRKTEYFRERLRGVLKEELETKYYNYGEVMKKLRVEIFVLNQTADLFQIYDARTQEYDHERILEVICEGLDDVKPEDFTIDTEVSEDMEEEDEDKVYDFFYNPIIHDRLTIAGRNAILDLTGLTPAVSKTLLTYVSMFREHGENEKKLMVKVGMEVKDTGITLLGLPFNAKDIITEIISGEIDIKQLNLENKTVKRTFNGIDLRQMIKKDLETKTYFINLTMISKMYDRDPTQVMKYVLYKISQDLGLRKEEDRLPKDYNIAFTLSSESETKDITTSLFTVETTLERLARTII